MLNTKGMIFNIQRFSLHDGDGIRTCVFLKGCPLSCAWCHNIESQSFLSEIAYYDNLCIYCSMCEKVCLPKCHRVCSNGHIFKRDNCIKCGKCADVCPANAMNMVGKSVTCEEVINEVLKDVNFYGKDGGITITGGEPLAQPEFTYALAYLSKKNGLTVDIETSGFGSKSDFEKLIQVCDCFLFDCKASHEDHLRLVGVDDKVILENLKFLCENGASVILRCPIVKGGNLNDEYIKKIKRLKSMYKNILGVELLPYHSTGYEKSKRLGIENQQLFETPNDDDLKKIINYLSDSNVRVVR